MTITAILTSIFVFKIADIVRKHLPKYAISFSIHVDVFVGLLSTCCIGKECTIVSHAVEIIERYEAVMGEPQEKKKPVQDMGVAGDGQDTRENFRPTNAYQCRRKWNNRSSETVQLSKALEDNLQIKPHFEGKPQSSTYPRSRRCNICNSTDHFFKECPIFNSCQ